PRGKTETSKEQLRDPRPLRLRRARGRILPATQAIRPGRARDHRFESGVSPSKGTERETARTRNGLARHRDANQPARSRELHRHNRTSPGVEDRVSRGGGVSDELHRSNAIRADYRWTAKGRVSRISADGLLGRPGRATSGAESVIYFGCSRSRWFVSASNLVTPSGASAS